MTWNHNLSEAPQDAPIWLAAASGIVIKSQWAKTKTGGYWPGFKSDGSVPPIAWQPFVVPAHPNLRESASEQPEAHGSSPCIGSREDHRPATYGQLVTAGETATAPESARTVIAAYLKVRDEEYGVTGVKDEDRAKSADDIALMLEEDGVLVVPAHPGTVSQPMAVETGDVEFMTACDDCGGV